MESSSAPEVTVSPLHLTKPAQTIILPNTNSNNNNNSKTTSSPVHLASVSLSHEEELIAENDTNTKQQTAAADSAPADAPATDKLQNHFPETLA